MPLPAALAARLAKRGIIKEGDLRHGKIFLKQLSETKRETTLWHLSDNSGFCIHRSASVPRNFDNSDFSARQLCWM